MSKVHKVRRLQIGEKIVDSSGGASPTLSLLWQQLVANSDTLDAGKIDKSLDLTTLSKLSGTGIAVRSDINTWAVRSLVAPAAGLSITNPAGIAGNPIFALSNDLAAVEGLSGTGFAVRTATDTWANRTLTAPAAGFTITNPDGVSGNPTFVLANDLGALEALSGTNTIYYRSAADTWTAVTVGSGLSFSGGTLSATGGGSGTVTTTGSPASGNLAKFSGATSIVNGDLSGDVTTSGTLATTLAASGVSAATYGDSTHVGQFTVDAKGRITTASSVAISGVTFDKARAYLNTAGTTSSGSWVKVPLDTVDYDTNSIWVAGSTRFTPKRSGYYQCNARVRTGTTGQMTTSIAKNGAIHHALGDDGTAVTASSGATLVLCNGTTDYIELYYFANSARSWTTGSFDTYLEVLGPF